MFIMHASFRLHSIKNIMDDYFLKMYFNGFFITQAVIVLGGVADKYRTSLPPFPCAVVYLCYCIASVLLFVLSTWKYILFIHSQ